MKCVEQNGARRAHVAWLHQNFARLKNGVEVGPPHKKKRATREFLFPGPGTSAKVLAFGTAPKKVYQRVFRFYANLRMAPRLRHELVTFYFNILEMKGAFALKERRVLMEELWNLFFFLKRRLNKLRRCE